MGQINIGGTSASVQLQGYTDSSITSDQAFTFPDTGGELVVTPGTKKIEVSVPDDAWGTSAGGVELFNLKLGADTIFKIQTSSSDAERYKGNSVISQGPYTTGDPQTSAGGEWGYYYLYNRLAGEYGAPSSVNGFALLHGDTIGWAVSYGGTTSFSNVYLNIEPENDDHYVSTTLEAAKASLETRISALEGGAS